MEVVNKNPISCSEIQTTNLRARWHMRYKLSYTASDSLFLFSIKNKKIGQKQMDRKKVFIIGVAGWLNSLCC
jgi:hypothetical protein